MRLWLVLLAALSAGSAFGQQFAPVGPLSFTKVFAGANPLPQILAINSVGASFAFASSASTSSGGAWLSVSVHSGCTGGGSCNTPYAVTVAVNPAVTLAVGTYNGQIVSTSSNGVASMTIPVTLTIAAADSAFFDNLPGQMSFSLKTGGLAPPSQTLQIRNGGVGSLAWTLAVSTADGGNWLSASAASGTAPSLITVSMLKQNLPNGGIAAGTFTGKLVFQTAGGGSVSVPVSVVVGESVFKQVNAISFTKLFAGPNPLPQVLSISSTGANFAFSSTAYSATGGNWLSVAVGGGCTGGGACNTSHAVTVTANPAVTLPAGTYTGQLVFRSTAGGLAITVPVTLTVAAAATPFFDNLPGQMSFSLKTRGVAPPSQTVEIRNGGSAGFLDWSVTGSTADGGNWLTISPPSGTAPSQITVEISVPNLPDAALIPGTFIGQLVFQSSGSRVTIPISVVVGDDVFNQVNALYFTKLLAGPNPLPQVVTIASTGTNFAFSTAAYTAIGGNWLSASIGGGCTGGGVCGTSHVVTATVNAAAILPAGTYTGQIVVISSTGSMAMTIPVVLTVESGAGPYLDNLPGQMSFSMKTAGEAPPAQSVQIRNAGSGTLNWTLETSTADGGGWLSASASSGTAPSSVTITLLKQNLPNAALVAGTFTGHLVFRAAGAGSVSIPVSVVVGNDVFQPVNAISFSKPDVGANPLSQVLNITSTGVNFGFVTSSSTSNGGNWLSVAIGSGCTGGGVCSTPHNITVSVNAAPTTPVGTYTGQIVLNATTMAMTIPVTLTITGQPPASCVTGVTPGSATAPQTQTISNFSITTNAGCNWTASSSASWLEIFPLSGTNSAAIQWTAYPNFGTQPRTAVVTVGDKTFSVTQAAGIGTQIQRFVRLLYFSYLGRGATDTEVAGWVNRGLTRAQLAASFLNSPEFNLGGRFTAGLYVGIIDRDAEFTGWQFQRQALARGIVNHDQLVSNFLNSAEFNLKFGALSNTAFVALMYENVLLRPGSQSEIDAWVNLLSNPGNTRTVIARSFLNSKEFEQGTGPRLMAFLLYSTLLLRDGTPQERATFEGQLANPAVLPVLIDQLANSVELNALLQ
jgi:hypothetical protein